MNRIQNLVDDELSLAKIPGAATTGSVFEGATGGDFDTAGDGEDAHCIFTPLHYERNYPYPSIVWLHGPDDDERQVTRIMPLVSMRNYVGVGSRGTVASANVAGGFTWSQGQRHIAQAEQRVLSALAVARDLLNIAPSRIYLGGYQAGGTMAFRIALNHPQMFAGVLSIGGGFPGTLRPLGQLHAARNLRTFLAIGKDSALYPESQVCDDLRLFHAAGMSLNLRVYPCGDEVLSNMLSDMDRWIMEQVAPQEPVEQDQPDYRLRGK
jgi:phospholipase/carboxylesterase